MGIRGLTGWVRWAAPESLQSPNWSDYADQTIGVDILGALYRIKARQSCPLTYMAQFIAGCKRLRIKPVFVFDGKPPDVKRPALEARSALRAESVEHLSLLEREVAPLVSTPQEKSAYDARKKTLLQNTSYFTSEERDQCKQLCYAAGVLCLNATGEADDVLAHLYHKGYFKAVVSNDLDLLARGISDVLVPQIYAAPGDHDGWLHYDLKAILHKVGLSHVEFVQMCVLMGCDYTVGQKNLPYRSAFFAIKYRGELLKTLAVLEVLDEKPYYAAIDRLNGLCETEESLMGEKQWAKFREGPPSVEPTSLATFRQDALKTLPEAVFAALY
jgi:flap endonuclease-1